MQCLILCYMGNCVKDIVRMRLELQQAHLHISCFQREDLVEALYEIKWNNFPPKYARYIQKLIHRWQNGVHLTVGPFEELSFVTATMVGNLEAVSVGAIHNLRIFSLQISKRIFSFVMMLLRFLE